jgi:hypothetical protein
MLFARVGALERNHPPVPEEVGDFGFKAIVSKHSFIDGVNSLIVSAQGWAIGQEDFLLKYLGERLNEAIQGRLGPDVEQDDLAIRTAFNEMIEELRGQGYSPSTLVVTGSLSQPLYVALQVSIQNPWSWYRELGVERRATHRFIGVHAGIPVVVIEAVRTPMLYAVDLAQFATLVRYGEGPDFDPEFRVTPFNDEEARKVLARQPRLILEPPPDSGEDEERVRQLQLRVGLELWETYKLDVKDPGAVIARPLADPVYD